MLRSALVADECGAALRTRLNVAVRFGSQLGCACIAVDINDFGDDLPSFLHVHKVAHPDVELGDLIGVVERRAFYSCPGEQHRFEVGDGRDGACATDLVGDGIEARAHPLGLELVGNGPARSLGRHAQAALGLVVVHFDHDAIDFEGQGVARFVPMGDEVHNAIHPIHAFDVTLVGRGHFESPARRLQNAVVVVAFGVVVAVHEVEEAVELALGDQGAVLVFECTGGCIARIGVELLACFGAFLVEGVEHRDGHEDFTADFKLFGIIAAQLQRNGLDGADVCRNVFAHLAIAAGEGLGQPTVLVAQTDGDAIVLELHDVLNGLIDAFFDAVFPVGNLVFAVRVRQRQHRVAVGYFFEFLGEIAPYPLGGRVGVGQFGMCFFEVFEFAQQRIELLIADGGLTEHVVPVVVVVQLLGKGVDAGFDGLFAHGFKRLRMGAARYVFCVFASGINDVETPNLGVSNPVREPIWASRTL